MKLITYLLCGSIFVGTSLALSAVANSEKTNTQSAIDKKFADLETKYHGKLGISVIDLNTNQRIQYRADESFPLQSTFKTIVVAAILKQSMTNNALLQKKIYYTKEDIRTWSPETEKHLAGGMTIEELCAAAIKYSDNTAVMLLIKELGSIDAVNKFARSIGDNNFNLIKTSADGFDITSTPEAMEKSLQQLTLNDILAPQQQNLLIKWMKENTTGNLRIRAGVPQGWTVADKTGSGLEYGITNDIAIIYPPNCKPIVIAAYFIQDNKKATTAPSVLASATKLIIEDFSKKDQCIKNKI